MLRELAAWLEAGDAADLSLEAAIHKAYQTGQPISEVIRDHADAISDSHDGARAGETGNGAETPRPVPEARAWDGTDNRDW